MVLPDRAARHVMCGIRPVSGRPGPAPRSRRPKTAPSAISSETADLIVLLRKELAGQGLDAGPDTIGWHLRHHHQVTVSRATINRNLTRAGLVTPEPKKRPKSSYIRFAAEQPNECWQSDFTHYRLADGTDTEILTWLDDHSRYALSVTAHHRVTGPIVLATFRAACTQLRRPGLHPDRQRDGLHHPALRRQRRPQRPRARTAPPGHHAEERQAEPPADPGQGRAVPADPEEVAGRPAPSPLTLAELQALLDTFTSYYNHPPPAPIAAAPGHPRHRLHRPAQGRTRRPRRRHPRPRPPRHASTTPAASPCATTADSTTSASAEPTPEPTSSCSSTTSTSASSTPPPANSSANSPSTPTRDYQPTGTPTRPPPGTPRPPRKRKNPEP